MSSFELGKSDWYTVQNVAENEFLNGKLESQQYGIYYSVKFEGDAETYLWQAKTAPVEGDKYYGHIEESKSGKSLRFKKDKEPEGSPQPAHTGSTQSTDESIARAVALKAAIQYHTGADVTTDSVVESAERFLVFLTGKPSQVQKAQETEVIYTDEGEPIEVPLELL